MRGLVFGALAIVLCAVAASAQAPLPVTAAYQQYTQAMQRGDLAGAETAASAALAASQARDGTGGRTPVLALNLARVRVQQGKWREAQAPTRQAYELSHASSASGVDPAMSGLLWGRVRLALEGLAAVDPLTALLQNTSTRNDLLGDRYDAAFDLGVWASHNSNHLLATRAWGFAADAAQGAPVDQRFARGQARTYEAEEMATQALTRELTLPPPIVQQIRAKLTEAYGLIRPFAFSPSRDAQVPPPQQLYAEILTWDRIVWSKVASDDATHRNDARLDPNPPSIDGVPVCPVHRNENGQHAYFPAARLARGQLAAVTMRMRFSDTGVYQGAEVAASVGDDGFLRNVTTATGAWTYSVAVTPACKPAPVFYEPVTFGIDQN